MSPSAVRVSSATSAKSTVAGLVGLNPLADAADLEDESGERWAEPVMQVTPKAQPLLLARRHQLLPRTLQLVEQRDAVDRDSGLLC